MAQRAALIVAIENYLEAGQAIPYATSDSTEIVRALPAAGYNPERTILLSGNRTTSAIVQSHFRRLPELVSNSDSLLVMIVGRGFAIKECGYVACSDSLNLDLAATSLSLASLALALKKVKCREITVLLDIPPLPKQVNSPPGYTTGLSETELQEWLDSSPNCVALLSARPGEQSHDSPALRHGIWRHHLIESLNGKVRTGLKPGSPLTASALQIILADAVPRTLRQSYAADVEQTPLLIGDGNATAVVAELGGIPQAGRVVLDLARMKRVIFRSETSGRIKDLAGFSKSVTVPNQANDWARKLINRLAAADVQSDLDATFASIREAFGYKRKDMEAAADRDGTGSIHTPDFEYSVAVVQNPDDPSEVLWRREVGGLTDAGVVRSPGFVKTFGKTFDRLVFEFAVPIDVAAFIDRVEDHPPDGVRVSVASGADEVEIRLTGFPGQIRVTRQSVEIEGRSASVGLLDQFLAFLEKFGGVGEPKALAS